MKLIKFIHTLLGCALLLIYASHPYLYNNDISWVNMCDNYTTPMLLIILSGSIANLLPGCYMTIKQGFKCYLQSIGSLSIIAGGNAALY
ncbi:MAG: hypothetical protein OXD32_06105, partial [Endozoicomonadaceae bacterium]|nr:hypothetical protein [Endozoicomonadaceae bacterium]